MNSIFVWDCFQPYSIQRYFHLFTFVFLLIYFVAELLLFLFLLMFFDTFSCWCYAEHRHALLVKIASVREVVLGAPLRVILKQLASRTVAPNMDRLVAIVHRPNESFFLVPQVKKFLLNMLTYFYLQFFFPSLELWTASYNLHGLICRE